jgi:uncharacterized protein (TIGR03083 family)
MDFEPYLDIVPAEAARLATVTASVLDERVPSCPDWTARELLGHLCRVYRFWHAQVVSADPRDRVDPGDGSLPPDAEPGAALEQAGAELVEAMHGAGPEAPCWNWSGVDPTVSWLARRMALETALHRYDGELCAGNPGRIDAELAADGIDEYLLVHLTADIPEVPTATLGGTLCLACSDTGDAWTVEIGMGRLRVREGRGPASACLLGTASDLLLFVWNRLGVDGLELTGDRAVANAWAGLPH